MCRPYILSSVMVIFGLIAHTGHADDVLRFGPEQSDIIAPDFSLPKTGDDEVDIDIEEENLTEIPTVIERPLGMEDGPFIYVNEFLLLNARDIPKLDICLSDILVILNQHLNQQPERGFSIGELQLVADEISNYYRKHGLILAQAIIPVQDVQAGVVEVAVVEGQLGRVVVEGAEYYSKDMLQRPFTHLMDEPVEKNSIESSLLRLTDLPGLSVFGVFQPGQLEGETDLFLKVQDERKLDFLFSVDNYGLESLDEEQFSTIVSWNNVTGHADQLTLSFQNSIRSAASRFFAVNYDFYLGNGWTTGFSWYKTDLDVGGDFSDLGLKTNTKVLSVFLANQWYRSRQFNLNVSLGLDMEKSEDFIRNELDETEQITESVVRVSFDHVDTRFSGLNFVSLEWRHGFNDLFGSLPGDPQNLPREERSSRVGGNSQHPTGQFDVLRGSITRIQEITETNTLQLRGEFQYSPDLLTSLSQYFAGGASSVRGLPSSAENWDTAFFLSAEWIVDAPFIANKPAFNNRVWGDIFQLSMFYDYATGEINHPIDTRMEGFFKRDSIGVGAYFYFPFGMSAKVLFAREFSRSQEDLARLDEREESDRSQFWVEVSYRF